MEVQIQVIVIYALCSIKTSDSSFYCFEDSERIVGASCVGGL